MHRQDFGHRLDANLNSTEAQIFAISRFFLFIDQFVLNTLRKFLFSGSKEGQSLLQL